jgi:hypothetical protein
VLAGLWTHLDLVADRFTFDDLLDVHELLDVKATNEQRIHEHETTKSNGS